MEIVGKVIQVLPLQTGTSSKTGNPWALQTFVIETQEQYPRRVCIELFGEDRVKANPVAVDELVTVFFDLESREFNGRWYTSVRAWKVQQGSAPVQIPVSQAAPQAGAPAAAPAQAGANTDPFSNAAAAATQDDGTDLPF